MFRIALHLSALAVALALFLWLAHQGGEAAGQAMLLAAMGFLTRDVAIFIAAQGFSGHGRADFAAIVVLLALYALIPAILHGLHLDAALVFFYPRASAPVWVSPAIAWMEAVLVAAFAVARLFAGEMEAVAG